MSNNKIAENIKKLRAKKGLSLEKIARLADLSLNTIVKVENDRIYKIGKKRFLKIQKGAI